MQHRTSSRRPARPLAAALWALLVLAACGERGREGEILAAGHVEATEIRISTKVGGTLEWFGLEEGARVTAGEEIARIDTVDLRLALEAAGAERAQAAAGLRLRQAGYRPEEIAEAAAQAAALAAELAAAERDLVRFQGLLDAGSGTEKSRDDALARRDRLAQELEAARQRSRRLRAGFRAEEIEAARARLAAAEARIAQVEQQIRDATVRAPGGGVVTEKLVEPGELLAAGTPLAVITDLEDCWLTAWIAEQDLGRVRLGQPARVVTDDGQVRQGTLGLIEDRAEFTPKNVQTRDERVKLVYRVKIRLDNSDGIFKPGMPAEAYLEPAAPAPGGSDRQSAPTASAR